MCGTIIDPKNIQSGTKLHYSPNGWIKVKDSDMEEYYYNIVVGEVQPDNYCDTEMCEGDERRGAVYVVVITLVLNGVNLL